MYLNMSTKQSFSLSSKSVNPLVVGLLLMDLEIPTQPLNPKDHSRFQVVKYFIQELKKRTHLFHLSHAYC